MFFIFVGIEDNHKGNRKAMNRNWSNQKANPAKGQENKVSDEFEIRPDPTMDC